MKLLLEAGADPDGAETDGSTALLKAVAVGHTAATTALLKAGADPNPDPNPDTDPCPNPHPHPHPTQAEYLGP